MVTILIIIHTYIMTSTEETCPVCFECYGLHEDGSFLCKDGVSNSGLEGYTCQHYLCIKCWERMYQRQIYNCPLCRENLNIWMITHIGREEQAEQGEQGEQGENGPDDEYEQAAAEDAGEQYRIERDQAERDQSEQEYREEQRRELRRERSLSRIGRHRRH